MYIIKHWKTTLSGVAAIIYGLSIGDGGLVLTGFGLVVAKDPV